MSIHKSLVTKGSLVRSRNVLTRYERIIQLRKGGKWAETEDSPFGLAKVRVLKVKKRGKEKKAKEEAPGVAGAPGAAAPAAAAAAQGQAPAAKGGAPAAKGAAPQAAAPAAKK